MHYTLYTTFTEFIIFVCIGFSCQWGSMFALHWTCGYRCTWWVLFACLQTVISCSSGLLFCICIIYCKLHIIEFNIFFSRREFGSLIVLHSTNLQAALYFFTYFEYFYPQEVPILYIVKLIWCTYLSKVTESGEIWKWSCDKRDSTLYKHNKNRWFHPTLKFSLSWILEVFISWQSWQKHRTLNGLI